MPKLTIEVPESLDLGTIKDLRVGEVSLAKLTAETALQHLLRGIHERVYNFVPAAKARKGAREKDAEKTEDSYVAGAQGVVNEPGTFGSSNPVETEARNILRKAIRDRVKGTKFKLPETLGRMSVGELSRVMAEAKKVSAAKIDKAVSVFASQAMSEAERTVAARTAEMFTFED